MEFDRCSMQFKAIPARGHHPFPNWRHLPLMDAAAAAASATRIVSCTFHDLHLVRGRRFFDGSMRLSRLTLQLVSHSFQSRKPDVPNYKCRMQYGASDNASAP